MPLHHESSVQAKLTDIAARAEDVAVRFHETIADYDRDLSALVRQTDASVFHQRVAEMVRALASVADEPAQIVALGASLGRQLAAHGIGDQHYARGADAMVDALRSTLGDAFSPDVEKACRMEIGVVQAVMQRATASP